MPGIMADKKETEPADSKDTSNAQGPQIHFFGDKNDGSITISFAEKDLEAYADLLPPNVKSAPISPDKINVILQKLNIVYGVQWESIQDAVLECNLNHKQVRGILLAKGDRPVNEVSEYFEMNPHLKEKPAPVKGNANVDLRSFTPFIIVKKDQALARLRPRKQGKEGKDIHGLTIPYSVIRPDGVSGGEHTRNDGKLILSEINGQLVVSGKILSVQDSLVIAGPVGYGTGNIIFPGDVVIDGPVSDGFKIYSGGSITIKQTFDVTDAIAKGDLLVAGGIIGRGQAIVKTGGFLKTKFIENCRVAARKTITVEKEIINSSVFTLERVELGEKGLILGGDIYTVGGIRAGGIGRKAGKATRIHCGIDFTAQQEKEKYNYQLRILAAKLAKLRELIAKEGEGSEKRAKLDELIHRLEAEQKEASAKVGDLLGRIVTNDSACVEVSGEIVPGTLIEICQVALFVSEPLRRVRIKLDKTSGRVISEELK
jgi:uncharacterized protein (DUF342 family)